MTINTFRLEVRSTPWLTIVITDAEQDTQPKHRAYR